MRGRSSNWTERLPCKREASGSSPGGSIEVKTMFDEIEELKFKTQRAAEIEQRKLQRELGYKPEIFEVSHKERKEHFFAIVKPKKKKGLLGLF